MNEHKQRIMELRNAILATTQRLNCAADNLVAAQTIVCLATRGSVQGANELIENAEAELRAAQVVLTERLVAAGVIVRGSGVEEQEDGA